MDRPANGREGDGLQRARRGKGEATGALFFARGDAEGRADAGRGDHAEGAAQAPAAHPLRAVGRDTQHCGLPHYLDRRNTVRDALKDPPPAPPCRGRGVECEYDEEE